MRLSFRLVLLSVALLAGLPAQAQHPLQGRSLRVSVPAGRTLAPAQARAADPLPDWAARVDPALVALVAADATARRSGVPTPSAWGAEPLAVQVVGGQATVDVLVQSDDARSLGAVPGVELRAVAGDVAVLRVPLDAVPQLAQRAGVTYVEAARQRPGLNDAARRDTHADVVQAGGGGLPRAFRGEGVAVGVLDSGLDVTHPAFSGPDGTRVQFLLEYLAGGGEKTWTKAQIDADPRAVTERDGTGGSGHGTHVTGTAAGSGAQNTGVAPAADILFVKGIRDPESSGGFSDADVLDGVSRMMQQAAARDQPVVVNLSLGGHYSPHDGSSLYERALSNLAGPGRIIVAAAGNEGGSAIHAGETSQPNVLNETLWLPEDTDFIGTTMWYDAGSYTSFAVGAYDLVDGQLSWLGYAAETTVGNRVQATFVDDDGVTRGTVQIDARTAADPRNGDGNADFTVSGGGIVDVSATVWSVIAQGPTAGRADLWALRSEFYNQDIGFADQNEMPGNTDMTVGTPSTALGVLAVGAHVTASGWTNVDGSSYSANPAITVGARAGFSSRGPTRDGRRSPDLTAPGQFIASALSSQVGDGLERARVLPGGYSVLQGTSMASPHAAGVVALMLQADPSLTAAEARDILQATARADGFTGAVPNDDFGAGKVDALAAVVETLARCGDACSGDGGGGGESGSVFAEAEPNNSQAQAFGLSGAFPMTVTGAAEASDVGALRVTFSGGGSDDLEDLYRVTTGAPGLTLTLSGYSKDLDLYLLNAEGTSILKGANTTNPAETIAMAELPAGTYLVGVSYYDPTGGGLATPINGSQTPYSLRIEAVGANAVANGSGPVGELTLYPVAPNPVRGRAAVEFELPAPADVRVVLYDVLGREVAVLAEGPRRAGPQAVALDAGALSAGTYVVRLTAGAQARTQRLVVVR